MQAKVQHVVAIPYPAQGHITPMLQLCQHLVPRGFTFTFIITSHIHQRILRAARALSTDEMNQPYCHNGCSSIRMVPVMRGSPPELHATSAGGGEAYLAALAMQGPVEDLLSSILEQQGQIGFILFDVFMGWSHATARKFCLGRVAFWPAAAATFSAFLYCADLALEDKSIRDAESDGLIHGISGLPPTDLNDIQKLWDDTGCFGEFVKVQFLPQFRETEEASYLVFNTFSDLEGSVADALSHRIQTVMVGPLLPSYDGEREVKPQPRLSLFSEDETCLVWLDKQAPSSVVFVSFGSVSLRSEEQIQELAKGLEASNCPFVWVHRQDLTDMGEANKSKGVSDGNSILEGFSQEAQNRCMIVPWVPQLQVLSHPSVGGFMTHCGWNSVLESLSMGVPMLCWADTGERMSNQRFVVEIWKCGMAMVADSRRYRQHIEEALLITREEVESAIRSLMLEEVGAPIRFQAAQLKDVAQLALQESQARLDEFAGAMQQACQNTLD